MKKAIFAALAASVFSASAFAAQPYAIPPIGKAPGERCAAVGGQIGNDGHGNYICCRKGIRIRPDGTAKIVNGKEQTCSL